MCEALANAEATTGLTRELWLMVADGYRMLVEDEEQIRSVARTILVKLGYRVLEARDADAALNLSAKHVGAIALLLGWALMTASFVPMLRLYRLSLWRAPLLPAVAVLYAAMTADSARRHYAGRGGAWKGRVEIREKPEPKEEVRSPR